MRPRTQYINDTAVGDRQAARLLQDTLQLWGRWPGMCAIGATLRCRRGLPGRSSGKHCRERSLASLMPPGWNQIIEWLRLLEGLRYVS